MMAASKNLRSRSARGFSLLEMVVAMAILAFSLAALYQAVSGATKNVRSGEKYAYGIELAKSLVAANYEVPIGGVALSGSTAGEFNWQVRSAEVSLRNSSLPDGALHELEVLVNWQDGLKQREVLLRSVVGGY
jgi:general secretion pathway protein I